MMRLISVYCCVVLFLSYGVFLLGGTQGRTWWQDRSFYTSRPPWYEPIVFQVAKVSLDQPKHFYRNNVQRNGYYNFALSTKLKSVKIDTVQNLAIHSASKASPLVLKDQYIVETDTGILASYDLSGKLQWKFKNYTSAFGFHGTPAVWGDLLIAGDYSGLMVALDRKTGKMQWALQLGNTFGASPLITEDGFVIVSVETHTPDGFIAKVRAQDGKIQWLSSWLGEQSHSSPALSEHSWGGSKVIVVGDNGGYVNGIRETDGTQVWRYYIGKPVKATPAIYNDVAYVSAWDGNVHAISAATGAVLWKKPLGFANQSSIAIVPDGSYGFINSSKGICRFSLTSKQDMQCEDVEMSRGTRKASPVITRDKAKSNEFLVWAACDRRALCVFDVHEFKRRNKWVLPSSISGEPVPSDGSVTVMLDQNGLVQFK